MFAARYALSSYITHIRFVFKGSISTFTARRTWPFTLETVGYFEHKIYLGRFCVSESPCVQCSMVLNTPFFWHVMPCNWVIISRRFELTCVSIFMGLQVPTFWRIKMLSEWLQPLFQWRGVVSQITEPTDSVYHITEHTVCLLDCFELVMLWSQEGLVLVYRLKSGKSLVAFRQKQGFSFLLSIQISSGSHLS